jgi:TPR repeat protein/DNA repair exonuclease SbcCD ATPase subunit
VRNTAALTQTIRPAGIGRCLAGVLLFGCIGLLPGQAEPAAATDLNEIRTKAEHEDLEAQNALGNVYTNALLGVKQDYAEALRWYRQAAEKGFAPAQFNLGLAYELGRGLPPDERLAFQYYLKAAEQGFAAAQFNVGNMYSAGRGVGQDLFEANLWYKQAAEKGVTEAQFNLGLAYEAGRGVKKDEVQAARWYKQAADRGFARAQFNLGLLLEDGRGVPKNEAMAAGFYRAAAEQGFAAAQNNYGLMLSAGRGGLAKDPLQAYVWLSLAVANGTSPAARDFVAKSLSAGQLAAAKSFLSDQKAGKPLPAAIAQAPAATSTEAPVSATAAVAQPAAQDNAAASRLAELTDALAAARQANSQLAEANQRLELEKARREQESVQGSEKGKLIEQLRDQSRRLSEQLQSATTEREAAQRESAVLAGQIKDVQQELAQQKAVAAGAPAADVSKYEGQIATLAAKLDQATGALNQLQQTNQQLTEGNAQLLKEKEAWTAAKAAPAALDDAGKYPVQGADKDAIIANLQRDNVRLNDEVKRSTIELLSLNQQIRNLRNQAARPGATGAGDNAASAEMRTENQRVDSNNTRLQAQRDAAVADAENLNGQLSDARSEITKLNEQISQLRSTRQSSDAASDQLAQLTSKAAQAETETGRLQQENSRLAARVAELEKQPRPVADRSLAAKLAQAEQAAAQSQAELKALQTEKAGLEQLTRTQEKNLRESAVAAQAADADAAGLRQKLAQVQKQVEENAAALTAREQDAQKLALENQSLAEKARRAEESLAAAKAKGEESGKFRQQLAELQDRAEQLVKENQDLSSKASDEHGRFVQAQARVTALEGDLRLAQKKVASAAGSDELKKQLADANQSLEKSSVTVAALTATAQSAQQELAQAKSLISDLQQQLAAAKLAAADTGAMRDELDKLRRDAAGMATLREEHEALAAKMTSEHDNLVQAQSRVAALEKDLQEAQRKPAADSAALAELKQQLTDANQALEKNGATVTGLTATAQGAQQELAQAKSQVADLQQKLVTAGQAVADTGKMREELDKLRHDAADTMTLREAHQALVAEAASLRTKNEQLTRDSEQQAGLMTGDRQELAQERARVAELGAANARLEKDLAESKQGVADAGAMRDELDKLRRDAAGMATLREEHEALAARMTSEHDNLVQAQSRVAALEKDLQEALRKPAADSAALAELKQQLTDANQALEKNGATVAELTAANDRLDKELAVAKQAAAEAEPLRTELAKLKTEADGMAALREGNDRLRKSADEVAALRARIEQLTRDNEQQAGIASGNRRDLDVAQARVAELEKLLDEARTVHTGGGDDTKKLQAELVEANQSIEKLNANVAELTGTNDRLEKDLDSARKSTAAALAAQSQAVSAAQPDAYKMEINTLQAHIKELEGQMEEERSSTAKEIATLASQLQRTRETNKSLTEANRALLDAKQSEQPVVDKGDFDKLQARVNELTAAGEELKRQNQKLTADNQGLVTELATFKQQLDEARKTVTLLPGLTDEKTALQEKLESVGAQLLKTQQEVEALQKDKADAAVLAAADKAAADKTQTELTTLQARVAEAEKASDSHSASVAELTQANVKLEQEREDMRRLVESYRGDINRLTQNVRSAEQQKVEAERGAQQNIDAVTAQLGQLRRELENARTAQARLAEASAAQERERAAIITQLRTENGALAARLNQAQGTLDQIAAAARLGTPAATIASGGTVPVRPVPSAAQPAEVRYHTVAEGDSLSRISLRYYGTPNRWQEIFQANRDVLQGSSALRVGMQLRIP